jgi:acyl-CoA synthetase (NDP forming)
VVKSDAILNLQPETNTKKLWEADSIAIIGASNDPLRIGGRPISYMLQRNYKGRIYPVNPKQEIIQGLKAYPSVEALPETPDIAIIAVASGMVNQMLADLGKRGTRLAVILSAGFSEVGNEGKLMQEELIATAKKYGIRVLGPNTLGFYDDRQGLFSTFSSAFELYWPQPGSIAIASQSGAFALHIFCSARNRGIGIPLCVTTGNEADINVAEVMLDMVRDPEIQVIGVYLEGLSDPEKFIQALKLAKQYRKPVVVMKTGRSAIGQVAAQSHTASIAGDDVVFDAVLKEYAAVRAYSPDEFLDIAYMATKKVYPERDALGVITISGGAGILISDVAEDMDLSMPELEYRAQKKLKEALSFAAVKNPVDCTAQVINQPELADQFLSTMLETGQYTSILGFFAHAAGTASIEAKLRPELSKAVSKYPDALLVLSLIAEKETIARYEADGFTVFEDPVRAVRAIKAMSTLGTAFSKPDALIPFEKKTLESLKTTPDEAEAKRLLEEAGLQGVPEAVATDAAEAGRLAERFGFPVVMKILSPDIKHKSEIGGVILNVSSIAEVHENYALLLERAAEKAPSAKITGVLIAKQVNDAVECIMGVKNDPIFGPVAMFGLGGIHVEVLKDVVLHRCPFNAATAKELILSIRSAAILQGVRGKPAVDIDGLAGQLSRLSVFAAQAQDQIKSVEVNPILAVPGEKGCYIADALIEV